jgi:hypothetical protein
LTQGKSNGGGESANGGSWLGDDREIDGGGGRETKLSSFRRGRDLKMLSVWSRVYDFRGSCANLYQVTTGKFSVGVRAALCFCT